MKIKEIEISRGATVNIGGYQSARVDVTLRAQLEEGEDAAQVEAELDKQVIKILGSKVDDVEMFI